MKDSAHRERCIACAGNVLRVLTAETFLQRLRGLRGPRPFANCDALRLPSCCAIHTFGMRQRIDVVFVGGDQLIQRILRNVARGRICICLRAAEVWEFRAGATANLNMQIGDPLPW